MGLKTWHRIDVLTHQARFDGHPSRVEERAHIRKRHHAENNDVVATSDVVRQIYAAGLDQAPADKKPKRTLVQLFRCDARPGFHENGCPSFDQLGNRRVSAHQSRGAIGNDGCLYQSERDGQFARTQVTDKDRKAFILSQNITTVCARFER